MTEYHELGLLQDLWYCELQSLEEDSFITRRISELGMILNEELEEMHLWRRSQLYRCDVCQHEWESKEIKL